jgi:DNA-binding PadR family transcriptional regulator
MQLRCVDQRPLRRAMVSDNKRRAREYRLTAAGQRHLAEEQDKWNRLTKAVGKVVSFA